MRAVTKQFETIVDLERVTGGAEGGGLFDLLDPPRNLVVRKCSDASGWVVEQNPKTGKYFTGPYNGNSNVRNPLPEGMTPEKFCS